MCTQSGGSPRTYDDSDRVGFQKKFPPTLEPGDGKTGPSEDAIAAISSVDEQPLPENRLLKVTRKVEAGIMAIQMTVRNAKRLIIRSYDSTGRKLSEKDVSGLFCEI